MSEHGVKASPTERADMLSTAESGGPDAAVCLWEQPDLSRVLQVNQIVCQRSVPCLFVDLSHGQHATLGPFFVPGEGSCYACFRERLRQNTAAHAELVSAEHHMVETGTPLPAYGMLPAFRYWLVGLAGAEITAFLVRHRPLRTLNRAITVDYERLQMWSEAAWRVPWCEVCGADGP